MIFLVKTFFNDSIFEDILNCCFSEKNIWFLKKLFWIRNELKIFNKLEDTKIFQFDLDIY